MFEDLDEHDIAQSIRQERQIFHGSFLLVEGKKDFRVLRNFVDNASCSIHPAHSKALALRALEILEDEGFPGILCIIDTDYEYSSLSSSRTITSGNIVETGVHDMDVAIISSPAFDRYVNERCDDGMLRVFEQQQGKPLKASLFAAALPIGCLRLLSHINQRHMRLSFRDLNYSFISPQDLSVDEDRLIASVLAKSRIEVSRDRFIAMYRIVRRQTHDVEKICQGHDLTRVLSIALTGIVAALCSSKTGRPDPRSWQSEVEMGLRLAFGRFEFEQTAVYFGILDWERRNPVFRILK